ncbi:hypothetical protein V6N13_000330 [Hibiscus sabdariffa]|uniref:Uncharacterized protein n=1 Tax=Hibiscus sabdariffa TaxID=183260 RepID=A0ABR2G597_9ROSI
MTFVDRFFGHRLPNFPYKTIVHIVICIPSSITFSLLGRAATIQAVSDSYNGINLDGRRLLMRSCSAWIKLLHTTLWELLIILGLFGAMAVGIASAPKILETYGICSVTMGFWGTLGLLGIPFCLVFAQVIMVGNMAKVISVLESECCGLGSLWKAKNVMEGRRQTGLVMAVLSNIGLRLVECLFELRICRGICMWEIPVLISMYSSLLLLETVMNHLKTNSKIGALEGIITGTTMEELVAAEVELEGILPRDLLAEEVSVEAEAEAVTVELEA